MGEARYERGPVERARIVLALRGALALVAARRLRRSPVTVRVRLASGAVAPTPQPALGTADASTVLMGAATAGAPGEAWAYRVLPLDVPPPSGVRSMRRLRPPPRRARSGQLVFERATDADPDWTIAETPLNEEGQPYRGMEPNRLSARIAPHGGGLLVGQDSTRPSGKQTVVLARDPGGRFRVLPEPPAGVLLARGRSRRTGRKRRHERRDACRKGRLWRGRRRGG